MSSDRRVRVPNGLVNFAQKVGIVAGAVCAVGAIAGWLTPRVWKAALQPAYAYTDTRITQQEAEHRASMEKLQQQQLDMLSVLLYRPGTPERQKAYDEIKAKWALDKR